MYNVGPTSETLSRYCTNVIQMFCVYWERTSQQTRDVDPMLGYCWASVADTRVNINSALGQCLVFAGVVWAIKNQSTGCHGLMKCQHTPDKHNKSTSSSFATRNQLFLNQHHAICKENKQHVEKMHIKCEYP